MFYVHSNKYPWQEKNFQIFCYTKPTKVTKTYLNLKST